LAQTAKPPEYNRPSCNDGLAKQEIKVGSLSGLWPSEKLQAALQIKTLCPGQPDITFSPGIILSCKINLNSEKKSMSSLWH